MKTLLGILLVVSGIILALYVGIWYCFVGGIVDVIEQIRAAAMNVQVLAWGIARIMFASLFGWLSGVVLIGPGLALLGVNGPYKTSRRRRKF